MRRADSAAFMTHKTTQLTMKATHILSTSNTTTTTMDPIICHQCSSTNNGPAIDRHNPIIQDQTRLTKTILKTNKNNNNDEHHEYEDNNKKSKHTKISNDQKTQTIGFTNRNNINNNNNNNVVRRGMLFGWGCTRPTDFISPASSSRFLLMDKPLSDQFDPLLKHVTPPTPQHQPPPEEEETVKPEDAESSEMKHDDNASSSPIKTSSYHQVVVLRVSLHCRGCEKKMRKHLSKMEGVTSFTIDFIAKTVTVVGNITPLAVLMSVSKVKNAKLLTPTTITSPLEPRVELNLSELHKPVAGRLGWFES